MQDEQAASPAGADRCRADRAGRRAAEGGALRGAEGHDVEIELATDWKVTAGEMATTLPTIVTTFEVACDDVAPDGTMKLHAKVLDASAHERPDSQVNPASIASELEPLKGTTLAMNLAPMAVRHRRRSCRARSR